MQISLFDKNLLVTTENLPLGVLRIRGTLQDVNTTVEQYRESLMKITPRMSELKNFAWLGGHGIQENGCDPRHQQDYLAGESQYFNPIRQQVMLDMICLCNNLISGKISWKSVIDSPEHYCNTGSAGIFFHFI